MTPKYSVFKLYPKTGTRSDITTPILLYPISMSEGGSGSVPVFDLKSDAIKFIESRTDYDTYTIVETYER